VRREDRTATLLRVNPNPNPYHKQPHGCHKVSSCAARGSLFLFSGHPNPIPSVSKVSLLERSLLHGVRPIQRSLAGKNGSEKNSASSPRTRQTPHGIRHSCAVHCISTAG